eukprot:scaffold22572_cov107-Amphora_coffeaeformis.AAC.2
MVSEAMVTMKARGASCHGAGPNNVNSPQPSKRAHITTFKERAETTGKYSVWKGGRVGDG